MMETVFRFLQKFNHEFSRFANQMDSTQWLTIAVIGLVIGLILLRGNPLRSS